MPTTVRRRTRPASPATRPQKVTKPGAVKHGRRSFSRPSSETGRFSPGGIGGFPRREADNSTADASAFSRQDHEPKAPQTRRVAPSPRLLPSRRQPDPPTLKSAKVQMHHFPAYFAALMSALLV